MAVTKRTRFEVLRRDDYTCRYCRSKANEITIDHVVPIALGGSDDPNNLVAACRDCNYGKASAAPDAALVADVEADALRWARAIAIAAEEVQNKAADRDQFLEYIGGEWLDRAPTFAELPDDWETTAWGFYTRGLPVAALDEAIDIAVAANVPQRARWKYFCGVCWNKLRDLEKAARKIVEEETRGT